MVGQHDRSEAAVLLLPNEQELLCYSRLSNYQEGQEEQSKRMFHEISWRAWMSLGFGAGQSESDPCGNLRTGRLPESMSTYLCRCTRKSRRDSVVQLAVHRQHSTAYGGRDACYQ